MVKSAGKDIKQFKRDELFLSIYESCRHRPTAIADATAITEIAISQVLGSAHDGVVEQKNIVDIVHRALHRFDKAAATIYSAYHSTVL